MTRWGKIRKGKEIKVNEDKFLLKGVLVKYRFILRSEIKSSFYTNKVNI